MNDRELAADLSALPERYRLVLCDIWGCIHDGVLVFQQAAGLLERWRGQGRIVLLISNAPRPGSAVQGQLDRLGLSRTCYDSIVTSGDTGIAALKAEGVTTVGFIGTPTDRIALEESGLALLPGPDGADVVCTGFAPGTRDPATEDDALRAMLPRKARLHCLNPDRVVVRGPTLELCAGTIAERYEAMGGPVAWYGKPYPPVYRRCLAMAEEIGGQKLASSEVVAVGDSLSTDFAGAARAGFDFIWVTHGIERAEVDELGASALIERFVRERGLHGLPQPIAVVRELGQP